MKNVTMRIVVAVMVAAYLLGMITGFGIAELIWVIKGG